VHALAEAVSELARLTGARPGLTLNVGRVVGGGPVNVVPDLAIARFNVRISAPADQPFVERRLAEITAELSSRDGITAELAGAFGAPAKPLAGPSAELLEQVVACGRALGFDLGTERSGGVCDGNRLAAWGVPCVDSLGPRGVAIHTAQETVHLDTLTERAQVSALLLERLACGEIRWPSRRAVAPRER
jgi:glutamate carboxypeptidase